MSRDFLTVDSSLSSHLLDRRFDLQDLEAVRLVLQGDSGLDWHKLDLDTVEKVDRFLKLHVIDLNDPRDAERLRFLFHEAVNYLEENFGLNFPEDLRDPADVRQVFIAASRYDRFRRRQILACMILKLMHVINHMEAADLKFQTSVSEAHLIELAERRIVALADHMRQEGFPLVAFYGSRKTRSSIITKLLVKTEAHATTIFDKLRFRVVTEQRADILPAIVWLTRNVFPFSYVIPGQSYNNLMTFSEMVRGDPRLEALVARMDGPPDVSGLLPEFNPFSGSTYRVIKFIVDFPVRIDPFLVDRDPRHHFLLGRIVYVMVEFQILDQETARLNEQGENAHALYKERQRRLVARRLRRGRLTGDRARSRDDSQGGNGADGG